MNMFGLINIGVLPLLLEASFPAFAQHDQEAKQPKGERQAESSRRGQDPRPADREQRPQGRELQGHPQARPEQQPLRAQPARPEGQSLGNVEQGRPRPMPRPAPGQGRLALSQQSHAAEQQTIWQQHRAGNWQAEHRTWQDRGGYAGYRIPDARYRGHFGPRFSFRMFSFPVRVVGGHPRFQYGGFWFSVMDPWPEYWSLNWYDEDDLYIDYFDGGYYLQNRRHPQDRIAIRVQMN